ncbi:RluA family pseudouridine synthase [Acidovorax sp. 106]|uniref:RluA family pseudouridine synthase n=1 Tax=Acidovorax sp. 106 TaxID=2135637 RepID=UPI000EAC86E8|nr:RluA family pseudouridine synthase [Acidovorax sp. 106]RLJ39849.1 ribosomal large subunit pseudouridine synthase A [Acidovorax sp. 106]
MQPLPPAPPALEIPAGVQAVYEDEHLLVLHKPAGLLCVPGRGEDKQDCLSARAQTHWPGALIVHRLDQATSGLVLMARSLAVQRQLSEAFATRQVQKRYVAVVHGALGQHQPQSQPEGPWQLIDLPIAADWERRPLRVVDATTGKPSQTHWRAVGYDSAQHTTRVALEPLTGRTHQLRVHLSALGHPIVGDTLYAPPPHHPGQRLLLHARELGFAHPVHATWCHVVAAEDF